MISIGASGFMAGPIAQPVPLVCCVGGPAHGERVAYNPASYGLEISGKKYTPHWFETRNGAVRVLITGKQGDKRIEAVLRRYDLA